MNRDNFDYLIDIDEKIFLYGLYCLIGYVLIGIFVWYVSHYFWIKLVSLIILSLTLVIACTHLWYQSKTTIIALGMNQQNKTIAIHTGTKWSYWWEIKKAIVLENWLYLSIQSPSSKKKHLYLTPWHVMPSSEFRQLARLICEKYH